MLKPHKLSLQDFTLSLTLSPRLVIEMLVENSHGEIYLKIRENHPYIGTWHLPGGFLLKGEFIKDCVPRLLAEELSASPTSWEFVKLFENPEADPRGHLLHYFVKVKIDGLKNSSKRRYFSKIPKDIMSFQKPMLLEIGYLAST